MKIEHYEKAKGILARKESLDNELARLRTDGDLPVAYSGDGARIRYASRESLEKIKETLIVDLESQMANLTLEFSDIDNSENAISVKVEEVLEILEYAEGPDLAEAVRTSINKLGALLS